jgi:hypothetical protein
MFFFLLRVASSLILSSVRFLFLVRELPVNFMSDIVRVLSSQLHLTKVIDT